MISTFNLTKLHGLLEDFYRITSIRITVLDDSFREIDAYPERISEFCRLIRTDQRGYDACHLCDQKACERATKDRSLYTYQCHAGLTESILPIIVGNIVIGYLLFGQVFSYSSYHSGWQVIQKLCKEYHINQNALQDACYSLPMIQESYITSASHIMQTVASYLCMERMVSLRQQELPVQIDEYIQEHFTENIDAVSIAQHFSIGKTKLYELAHQSYGMGVAEYIRNLRIKKAKELLTEDTELSLAEIASECGFIDYNYFITVFKRVTGMPPKSYAKQASIS